MPLSSGRAGALNKMVEIQYNSTPDEQDGVGQPVFTWKRFTRAWCAVESIDTNERFQAGREVGHKLRNFTFRWRNDLKFEHRIVYEGEYYNIRSIKEMERKGRAKFLEVLGEIIEGATK